MVKTDQIKMRLNAWYCIPFNMLIFALYQVEQLNLIIISQPLLKTPGACCHRLYESMMLKGWHQLLTLERDKKGI